MWISITRMGVKKNETKHYCVRCNCNLVFWTLIFSMQIGVRIKRALNRALVTLAERKTSVKRVLERMML